MSVTSTGNSSNSSLSQNLDKLKDLDISNDKVLNLIDKITSSDKFGTSEQLQITEIMQQRSQRTSLLTNLSRMIHESAMSVIRNLRA